MNACHKCGVVCGDVVGGKYTCSRCDPSLLKSPGITIANAARAFGMSTARIRGYVERHPHLVLWLKGKHRILSFNALDELINKRKPCVEETAHNLNQ